MSFNPADYPPNWREIVREIRARARLRCECEGECGLHSHGEYRGRRRELHGMAAKFAKGKVVLTTAHLCHDTHCEDRSHLRAMCNRCHLRYDRDHHARHRVETRERKTGQIRLVSA